MTEHGPLQPAEFSRQLLKALDAAEGRRRGRKRDQTPDRLGLELKRSLLEKAAAEAPRPDEFERWLLAQALSSPASGPVRAMCVAIMDEYRLARHDLHFQRWLAQGAPSDDAQALRPKGDELADPRMRGL